jgi:hypothetical protein
MARRSLDTMSASSWPTCSPGSVCCSAEGTCQVRLSWPRLLPLVGLLCFLDMAPGEGDHGRDASNDDERGPRADVRGSSVPARSQMQR